MMPLRQSLAASTEPAVLPLTLARRFSAPDQMLTFDRGRLGVVEMGHTVLARAVFDPGWHWAPDRRTRDPQLLVGFVLGGRLGLRTASGRAFDLIGGDVFQMSLTRELEARVVGYRPAEVLYVHGTEALVRGLGG